MQRVWIKAAGVAALSAVASVASAQSLDKAFAVFTACDGSFFKALATDQALWQQQVPLENKDGVAWIKTPNRLAEDGNVVELPAKPTVAGLTVTHYLDEFSALMPAVMPRSHFAYWGFKVNGSLEAVASAIKPLVQDSKRLRKDGDVYVRTELKVGDLPWRAAALASGVPRPLNTERAFLLETDPELPNTVKVLCSLQGNVSGDMLAELRPDVPRHEWPASLDPDLLQKTAANEAVLAQFKEAQEKNPLLVPKFKRVSYTTAEGGDKNTVQVTVQTTGDGLLEVTEDYGVFKMQRQMLAGWIQAKGRMGKVGSVFRVESLELDLPDSWRKGDKLRYSTVLRDVPPEADSKEKAYSETCVVGDTFEASKIFATLSGNAIALTCSTSGRENKQAFIESLGLFVDYTPASGFFGSAKPKYTRFTVE
ncbi:hypothetical protein KIK84_11530 [Curvibacter sp. CHRR-16]|uniref:hypothetical protein n=1 Tax=Curvibacter sp. CHRR-16 TaxID=2835872 RepID=UPI001BD9BE17|nr:hypothetical protein [Curvibacter sp. CHRR-16]MBT0570963.1 hypothetical protein [Curvibacter sp. CHRR-16]